MTLEHNTCWTRWRSIFREADLDALDALREPERTWLSPAAFRHAAHVAEQCRLGLWVREKNLAGTPVLAPVLIDEFRKKIESQPPPV